MKLRFAQDRIRFRFSDDELSALAEGHSLQMSVCAPSSREVKLLECEVSSGDFEATSLEGSASCLRLQISRENLRNWVGQGGVSLKIDTPSGLELVIERDLGRKMGRKEKRSEDASKGETF
ncbi:MAG: hypothetical protein KGQ59_01425 [Bdellovibrionales bacterium]|nr:hypothetical protein [Bdellovibrionales bacterium]